MTPDQQRAAELAAAQRDSAAMHLRALEHDLATLQRWEKDPGGLRSYNLDALISTVRHIRTCLVRAEAFDALAKP